MAENSKASDSELRARVCRHAQRALELIAVNLDAARTAMQASDEAREELRRRYPE